MTGVPPLETERLFVRPFTMEDLPSIHQLLDIELVDAAFGSEGATTLEARRQWLQWTILGYEELAKLHQPPYGERAVVLKQSRAVIGACGYVPCLDAFGQLPALRGPRDEPGAHLNSTEFGLFYAISPSQQRQGYATEAARALVTHAFEQLRLRRVIATTTDDNEPSMGVMCKLGMQLDRNPDPTPPWLQVVGVLRNPALGAA